VKRVFQHVRHSQGPLLLCTFLYTWSPISEAAYDSFNRILTLSEFRQMEYFTWNLQISMKNFVFHGNSVENFTTIPWSFHMFLPT